MSLWFPNWQQKMWRLQVFEKKRLLESRASDKRINSSDYSRLDISNCVHTRRFPQIWHYFEKYRSAFIFSSCSMASLCGVGGTENNRDTYQRVNYIQVDVPLKYQPVLRKWPCWQKSLCSRFVKAPRTSESPCSLSAKINICQVLLACVNIWVGKCEGSAGSCEQCTNSKMSK